MPFILQIPERFSSFQLAKSETSSDGRDTLVIRVDDNESFELYRSEDDRRAIFVVGDLIVPRDYRDDVNAYMSKLVYTFSPEMVRDFKGFFYLVYVNLDDRQVIALTSMFGILPLYFSPLKPITFVSSSLSAIAQKRSSRINKKVILEKLFFNYPLFDDTVFEGISSVPANSYIKIDSGLSIKKHTRIEDYYVTKPLSWRKAIDGLADEFCDIFDDYKPNDNYRVTLTAGFDGRTLLSLLLAQSKPETISSFSYGADTDVDVKIPLGIARDIGFSHVPYYLDDRFAETHYLSNGLEFVERTDGLGNLSRAHYLYIARLLSNDVNYILTGNFGSEILRSMKVPGVMTSRELFAMFEIENENELRAFFNDNPKLDYIHRNDFQSALTEMIEDIFDYKASLPLDMTANQRFYIYLFENVFRKYFGPEIIIQQGFIHNRSPFLDFNFIASLLKTELAGANASLRESNPFARFRGQVLYAEIIKRRYPALLEFRMDKGYCPKDFFSLSGYVNIATSYVKKRFKHRQYDSPNYALQCFNAHRPYFENRELLDSCFNVETVVSDIRHDWQNKQQLLQNIISIDHYIQRVGAS